MNPTRLHPTVVAEPVWLHALTWSGFPVAGAATSSLFLFLLERAAAGRSVFPFAFGFLAPIPETVRAVGVLTIGGIAGLALAYMSQLDSRRVEVAASSVTIGRGDGSNHRIPARDIAVVFFDGEALVIQDAAGLELIREEHRLRPAALRSAFIGHAYPWRDDGDPHAADFRRWVEGTPELPPAVNGLLRQRAKALGDWTGDRSTAIETQLHRMGVVVRDEARVQYWRKQAEI